MKEAVQRRADKPVEGWPSIATYVSTRTGLCVSVTSVQRWSKRSVDPLPVKRWGTRRPRVVADACVLDAWCDRQWCERARQGGAT